MKKKWTGERLETHIYDDVAVEHLHRYAFAKNFIENKIVLDIACGEGYGSFLMSKIAKNVIGVDISKNAIDEANNKYKQINLNYILGSTDHIPVEDGSIDVFISFETIEHHNRHIEMYNEIKRVLKPNGILIISSPDRQYYNELQKNNIFHIKELYLEEFEKLNYSYFKHVNIYMQNCINGNSIIDDKSSFKNLNFYYGDYENIISKNIIGLYNIAVASSTELLPVKLSIFDGSKISKKLTENRISEIKNSYSYKFGNFILKPISFLKRLIK